HSGRDDDRHPLPFQPRQLLNLTVFLQRLRELQQEDLPAFLVDDSTTDEGHGGLYLRPFLEEVLGVLDFKVEVVLLSVRAEPDLLQDHLLGLGLDLLLLLLLFVLELGIVNNLANRWIRVGRYFHKVETLVAGDAYRLLYRIHIDLYIFSNYPHPGCCDLLIDLVRFFPPVGTPSEGSAASVVNTLPRLVSQK